MLSVAILAQAIFSRYLSGKPYLPSVAPMDLDSVAPMSRTTMCCRTTCVSLAELSNSREDVPIPEQWERGTPFIIWTDWKSPDADTDKGHILSQHADELMEKQCTFNKIPLQKIDIMSPPKVLIDLPCGVHALASPAPNMPD